MCEWRRFLAALIAFAAFAKPVACQTPSRSLEEQLRLRVEDLSTRLAQARQKVSIADSIARAAAKAAPEDRDTLTIGPMRIVVAPGDAVQARDVFDQSWREFDPVLGGRAESVRPATFLFADGLKGPFVVTSSGSSMRFEPLLTQSELRGAIRLVIGGLITDRLPSGIRLWEAGLPILPPDDSTRSEVRLGVVTAQSSTGRDCFGGDGAACWSGMGIVAAQSDPAAAWYSPAERRALVSRLAQGDAGAVGALSRVCLNGDDQACDEWLSQFAHPSLLPPFTQKVRVSLIWFALARGGPGAFERLHDAPESPLPLAAGSFYAAVGADLEGRLVAASRLDADRLIMEWRAATLGEELVSSTIPDGKTTLGTLAWMLVLTGLATRSTRWRLG